MYIVEKTSFKYLNLFFGPTFFADLAGVCLGLSVITVSVVVLPLNDVADFAGVRSGLSALAASVFDLPL